jgi:hypothetical protein
MAVEKLSLSFEPTLAERARQAAEATGQSLSAFIADAVAYRLKLEEARRLIRDWEVEHGPITDSELSRVRSRWHQD